MPSKNVKGYSVKSAINLGPEFCYECETWSLAFRDKTYIDAPENEGLRRICF
jgi:hypothetical protein